MAGGSGCAQCWGCMCVMLGIIAVCGFGVMFPTYFAPLLVETTVDELIVYQETDNELMNTKYDRFINGAEEPDIAGEYGDDGEHYYYYLYNVSNPAEFLQGDEKPMVTEIGPFGYGRYWRKYDVEFSKREAVNYKTYFFDKRLTTEACKTGMENMEHPEPKNCVDPNTKVTTFNVAFANVMHQLTPEKLASMYGTQAITAIMGKTVNSIVHTIKEMVLPNVMNLYFESYRQQSAIHSLYSGYAIAVISGGNDVLAFIEGLNNASAIGKDVSPFDAIQSWFSSNGLGSISTVFQDPATLETLFNPFDTFSPFNDTGYLLWKTATETAVAKQTLVNRCQQDSTQNCDARIDAIRGWMFSSDGWGGSLMAKERMYAEFVLGDNTFRCDGIHLCDWNLAPYMEYEGSPSPPISFEVFNSLYLTGNKISLLDERSYEIWKKVGKYCDNPSLTCPVFQENVDSFQEVLTEFITLDNATSNGTTSNGTAYYTSQICGIQNYVRNLYRNPFADADIRGKLPTWLPTLFSSNADLNSFTQVADIGFLQLANGGYSQWKHSRQTLSPDAETSVEFFHHFDQTLSWSEAKAIYAILVDPTLLTQVISRAHDTPSGDPFVPTIYKPNLEATFTDLVPSDVASLLAKKNTPGTATVATNMAKMVSRFIRDFVFKAGRVMCNDPSLCDFSKGGYFVTTSAENFLYNGYSDSGTTFLGQVMRNPRFQVQCNKQKYYFTDGTSGIEEKSGKTFRIGANCQKTRDLDCTSDGIEVIDTMDGSKYTWTRGGFDDASLGKYYNISENFYIGNVSIGMPPINALRFGSLHRNLEFQIAKSCSHPPCTVEINNGVLNRNKTGTIVSYKGKRKSQDWPHQVVYYGSLTGQFPPRYLEGMLSTDCPSRQALFSPSMQGTLLIDLEKRTTIDYFDQADSSIAVCRYSITKQSVIDTVSGLNASSHLVSPIGFFPFPPGKEATKANPASFAQPSFLLDSLYFNSKELAKFDGITPDAAKHGTFLDVEQSTGAVYRAVSRTAMYFKFSRNILFPDLIEDYYLFPSYSITTSGSIPKDLAQTTGRFINVFKKLPSTATGIGIGAGIVFMVIGLCLCSRARSSVAPH